MDLQTGKKDKETVAINTWNNQIEESKSQPPSPRVDVRVKKSNCEESKERPEKKKIIRAKRSASDNLASMNYASNEGGPSCSQTSQRILDGNERPQRRAQSSIQATPTT